MLNIAINGFWYSFKTNEPVIIELGSLDLIFENLKKMFLVPIQRIVAMAHTHLNFTMYSFAFLILISFLIILLNEFTSYFTGYTLNKKIKKTSHKRWENLSKRLMQRRYHKNILSTIIGSVVCLSPQRRTTKDSRPGYRCTRWMGMWELRERWYWWYCAVLVMWRFHVTVAAR